MKIAKPKLVYSIFAVCAVVSASLLTAGIYTGFFAEAGNEVAPPSAAAPAISGGNVPDPGISEATN